MQQAYGKVFSNVTFKVFFSMGLSERFFKEAVRGQHAGIRLCKSQNIRMSLLRHGRAGTQS